MAQRRGPCRFCVVCRTVKSHSAGSTTVDYLFQHNLWAQSKEELMARVPAQRTAMVCRRCVRQLREPYLVRDAHGRLLRLAVLPSDVVRSDGRGVRELGLMAIDAIPLDTVLPYCGKLISTDALLAVEERYGIVISPEWLVEPGSNLDGFLAFGQFVPHGNKFRVAHRINARRRDDKFRANCQFGTMTLTAGDLHDLELDTTLYGVGDRLPCYRVTEKRGIQPGEEIVVRTYGSRYWQKKRELERKAANGEFTIWQHKFLPPHVTEIIDDLNAKALRERKRKMQRNEGKENTNSTRSSPDRSPAKWATPSRQRGSAVLETSRSKRLRDENGAVGEGRRSKRLRVHAEGSE